MSSNKDTSVKISQIEGFDRRGKQQENLIIKKIRDEHGTLLAPLETELCKKCGIEKGQPFTTAMVKKLSIDKKGLGHLNFLNWDLTRKPCLVIIPVKKRDNGELFDQANNSGSNR